MIQIEVTLIPLSVQTDAGEITAGEGDESLEPAVIQSLVTESGVVRVIYPIEHIEDIAQGLLQAKEEIQSKPKADIYVPKSTEEVSQIAQAHDKITEGKS